MAHERYAMQYFQYCVHMRGNALCRSAKLNSYSSVVTLTSRTGIPNENYSETNRRTLKINTSRMTRQQLDAFVDNYLKYTNLIVSIIQNTQNRTERDNTTTQNGYPLS